MARASSTYSRLIAWLKVLLPLVALGLLSTIFLISNRSDPSGSVPIAINGDAETLTEGVSAPYFAGTTENGDAITMMARAAMPQGDGLLQADNVDASLRLSDGSLITLRSDTATLSDISKSVELIGAVLIESSAGYRIETDQLWTSLDEIAAESDGPIKGEGPAGSFSAGRMLVTSVDNGVSVQMLFTDGIKLIYDPQKN